MLNFEEYKATFTCNLSEEDFEKIMQTTVSPFSPDVEHITFVHPVTKEKREFVPVVRCKDCRHFFNNGTDNVAIYECDLLHEKMRDDFFCADGERRMNDEPHT